MYKITCKLQTSYGQATQELYAQNLPTVELLTKIMDDLVIDKTVLDPDPSTVYPVGLWQTVRFQTDSLYAGEILVEKVKVCDIAQ